MDKKISAKLEQCKTFCNEGQVFPVMKELVKKEKMGVREASRVVSDLTGGTVTAKRAERVYENRTSAPKGAPSTKAKSNDPPSAPKGAPKGKAKSTQGPEVVLQDGAAEEQWEKVCKKLEETRKWIVDNCIEMKCDDSLKILDHVKEIEHAVIDVIKGETWMKNKGKSKST